MRKDTITFAKVEIKGHWIGPSTAAKISGRNAHALKCNDNFRPAGNSKYRLISFYGKELSFVVLDNGCSIFPDGYDSSDNTYFFIHNDNYFQVN